MLQNTPDYLKNLRQWVLWRFEDRGGPKPTKVPISPHTGRLASVTDSTTWNNFETVAKILEKDPYAADGAGFVLAPNDGLAFIDFDLYDGDGRPFPDSTREMQWKIAQSLDSYMELSPGGGLHVIAKASVPTGRRWSQYGIEMYSQSRYMTMTGKVVAEYNQLKSRQTAVSELWERIAKTREEKPVTYAGFDPATETDLEVWNRAAEASNGALFVDLWNGKWQNYYYPSASEADYALIDIIAFYTPNAEQLRRMYFQSALGQRESVLNNPKKVEKPFRQAYDNKLPEYDFDSVYEELSQVRIEAASGESTFIQTDAPQEPLYQEVVVAPKEVKTVSGWADSTVTRPPGLMGLICDHIYLSAPRQIPEAAVAGAIGFMSAFAGRYWSVLGDGLAHYVLLVAGSGTGKEAMYKGVDGLFNYLIEQRNYIQVSDFRGAGDFSSGQAVMQYFSDHQTNCFLSMMGEFGMKLADLIGNNNFGPNITYKRALLDFYTKCSENGVVLQSTYSDKTRNTSDVKAPAWSVLGDSQPETLYDSLDAASLNSGLVPRFLNLHYQGKRNPTNRAHKDYKISQELDTALINFVGTAINKMQSGAIMENVPIDAAAEKYSHELDEYCDSMVNNNTAIYKYLWTRAYMKTMRLAGLVAVGCNAQFPTITTEHIYWAQQIVIKDIELLTYEIQRGCGGSGSLENSQMTVIKDIIIKYIRSDYESINSNGSASVSPEMFNQGCIPLSYFTRYAGRKSAFRKDKHRTATVMIRKTLQDMCDNGDLRMLTKPEAGRKFKFTGICFLIENKKIIDEARRRRFD